MSISFTCTLFGGKHYTILETTIQRFKVYIISISIIRLYIDQKGLNNSTSLESVRRLGDIYTNKASIAFYCGKGQNAFSERLCS